jgi:hypothetical protein
MKWTANLAYQSKPLTKITLNLAIGQLTKALGMKPMAVRGHCSLSPARRLTPSRASLDAGIGRSD